MGTHLRTSLKWGAIASVPVTLAALYLWNPHGDAPFLFLKLMGLFVAYPFLYTGFELQKYGSGPWLGLPVAVAAQLIWCVVLSLPVVIVVSWARRRPPSNSTAESDARKSSARGSL
jgi:hypothetical protein